MKSLLHLWKMLAQDMGERCAVDTARDLATVTRRAEHEGMEFLTITLPSFEKAFVSWLDLGQVAPSSVTGFRFRGGLPVFLRGFLEQVFDSDGAILDTASPDAILAIRQLTGAFGKMYLQASPERTSHAMLAYLETDTELEKVQRYMEDHPQVVLDLRRVWALLLHRVLDSADHQMASGPVTPKHGPGSTADRLLGNEKYRQLHWTWRLEKYFSSESYIIPSPRYWRELQSVQFKSLEQELPVRVIPVPKTQKTPRPIAMEPACMQYAQQAVSGILTKLTEEDCILKRIIRFSDQVPNQHLAREGSITGTLATLDLSEASDRVSNFLVRTLFGPWATLSGAIQACRSRRAEVRIDDSAVVTRTLTKFASMGSALTFPVEAMVFATMIFLGIEKQLGRRLRSRDIESLCGKVAVYGDDIIVPVDYVRSVSHTLESFGFKVNSTKSFWTGKFRESCGRDYYAGTEVTYLKFRKAYPADRRDVLEVVSLVSFFNQAKHNHYTHTTNWLRKELASLLGRFPRVSRDSEILGEVDDVFQDVDRMCPKLHRPVVKGWVIKTHVPENPLDGEQALLKYFLKESDSPLDREHLVRSGRSSGVSIILREAAA